MIPVAIPGGTRTWEAALIDKRAERGEQFTALVTGSLDRAYRLAGLILADASEAEEAVGDAVERAWACFDRLRNVTGFAAWFDRILVNGCRDRLRRRRVVRFIPSSRAMTDRCPPTHSCGSSTATSCCDPCASCPTTNASFSSCTSGPT